MQSFCCEKTTYKQETYIIYIIFYNYYCIFLSYDVYITSKIIYAFTFLFNFSIEVKHIIIFIHNTHIRWLGDYFKHTYLLFWSWKCIHLTFFFFERSIHHKNWSLNWNNLVNINLLVILLPTFYNNTDKSKLNEKKNRIKCTNFLGIRILAPIYL